MASEEKFALSTSRHFPSWLASTGASLAFTTYQANKVFFIGAKPDGKLSVFERTFERCMGLGVGNSGNTLALATKFQIYRFDNLLQDTIVAAADEPGALYAPHATWITGDLDAHDVAFDSALRPVFANTLFSCIATISDGHSFKPVWKPPFISRLAAEDRCHLNGLAMRDGKPAFVTCVSRSDAADGWRDQRRDGGVVVDVASNEIVTGGLSMPHSPRWHDGRLWLLNSGVGEFGFVDGKTGRFEPVAFCPGYARGLAFVGNHAVVGLSMARENRTFSGLALDDVLAEKSTEARCGLAVYSLATGDMVEWVRIEGIVRELYDVVALPGIARPAMIGLKGDQIHRTISIEE